MLKHLLDPLHPPKEWPTDLKLKCEVGQATLVELSPGLSYAAVAFADGGIAVLDTDTWSVIFRAKKHAMEPIALKWSSDASTLVSVGSDWVACVWNTLEKRLSRVHQLDFRPTAASFAPENHLVFAATFASNVVLCDISSETEKRPSVTAFVPLPDDVPASCVQMLKDGAVVVGTNKGMAHFLAGGEVLASVKLSTGVVRGFTYTPSGNVLAASCSDRAVRVFYLDSPLKADTIEVGHKFSDLSLHSKWTAMALSVDGEFLFAASDVRQGTIAVWNALGRFAIRHLTGQYERLTSLAFDPSRVVLIGTGIDSGAIYVWRAEPPKAWAPLIPEFEEIPDIEVYQETESDWDIKFENTAPPPAPVDVWTLPAPVVDAVIPVDL